MIERLAIAIDVLRNQPTHPMPPRVFIRFDIVCWLLLLISLQLVMPHANGSMPFDPVNESVPQEDSFSKSVKTYIATYCIECHHGENAKGDLDLDKYKNSADVIQNFRTWKHIVEFIQNGEMPPRESKQPSIDENNAIAKSVQHILITEAKKRDGDPGPVLPRRLSNTEYDNSVRDLTGIDIRPTKDFPPDPAGGEGFDNTGESLGISPNLLKKYVASAQLVADHLVLRTDGISFSPFPVTSYNERRKLTEEAIINFYNSHAIDVPKYIESALNYKHRPTDQYDLTVEKWASANHLSPQYLSRVVRYLESTLNQTATNELGYAARVADQWKQLTTQNTPNIDRRQLNEFTQSIETLRNILTSPEGELIQSNAGNWPINHLDFRAKVAAKRDRFDLATLKTTAHVRLPRISIQRDTANPNESQTIRLRFEKAFSSSGATIIVQNAIFSDSDQWPNNPKESEQHHVQSLHKVLETHAPSIANTLAFGKHPQGSSIEPDSFVVSAPKTIEISLPNEAIKQLAGKHLLFKCQLDTSVDRNGSVFVQADLNRVDASIDRSAQILMDGSSDAAKSLRKFADDFCDTFPNRFFYVDSGRGLAAGFHLVEGFFRDDQPLVHKVLSENEQIELDRLWRELDFVTESAETLLRGFVWFERAEREVLLDKRFDFLRPEDPQLVETEMLEQFEKLYLDKMGVQRIEDSLKPVNRDSKFEMIHGFFEQIRHGLSQHQSLLSLAEPLAIRDIENFAARAYRRPLTDSDRNTLKSLYRKMRADGLDIEAALRGLVTAILMSPDFFLLYREEPDSPTIAPLADHVLAARLSYFLWSTLPDDELNSAAVTRELSDLNQLERQTLRMLSDSRMQSFSREFFGQWLRYRDFIEKDPINAAAFPGYDDDLRSAMAEEPVQFLARLIQEDRPVIELLNSDVTMVNARLAKHYGPIFEKQYNEQLNQGLKAQSIGLATVTTKARDSSLQSAPSPWLPVSGLRQAGRGGLFGMAVVLAKNSAGERTSPVKRGFWSVHHLLGQHFPPPPADVPELPKSEATSEKSIRDLLALHVAAEQCARCHKHFDGLGLAMEGFDAIGRARIVDTAGRPIDKVAELPGGNRAQGVGGLIDYVEKQRHDDFIHTLCRKFLGYALGRSVLLSDQPLLDEMEKQLISNDYRFSSLFITVVRSQQFRYQRGKDYSSSGL